MRPNRSSVAGRVYLDLQARARLEGRPTDELLVTYVLERFLYRVSMSSHAGRLVLKGAMLLAVFDGRRATRDVDLLAREFDNDVEAVADLVRSILRIEVDDGVTYDVSRLAAGVIRETDLYEGVRLTIPASIDRAQVPLRIDLNVGDPVTPAPVSIEYPTLLAGEPFRLSGYPLVTVLAEKIVTMIERGDANTRERDFVDVYLLIRRHEIMAADLFAALDATAGHRGSQLRSLQESVVRLGVTRKEDWRRTVAKYGLADEFPADFSAAIQAISEFVDPVLSKAEDAGIWLPPRQRWVQQ